jgi:hypothetical protein
MPNSEKATSDVKSRALGGIFLIAIAWLACRALASLAHLGERQLILLLRDAGLIFVRVNAALLLGAWCRPEFGSGQRRASQKSPSLLFRLPRPFQPQRRFPCSVPSAEIRWGNGHGDQP